MSEVRNQSTPPPARWCASSPRCPTPTPTGRSPGRTTAYLTWRDVDLADRAAVLARVAELYRQHATELAELMTLEMGKPITQARGEVELSAAIYEYYATNGPELLADEELDIAGSGQGPRAHRADRRAARASCRGTSPTTRRPVSSRRTCCWATRSCSSTPRTARSRRCESPSSLDAAGAPAGVYQNVFATTDQVATMIASPLLQGVSLTGSERAGSAVGELAGRHLKKCVLELGGSDPFIVLPGADLDKAVTAAVAGRFGNAGQVCTSSKRMIVESSVWDEFLARVPRPRPRDWRTGDPMSEDTRLGPMASVAARADLADQVDDAITKGATVHLGGEVPDGPGAFYPATVLSGVTPAMRAYHEELFGPVAVLLPGRLGRRGDRAGQRLALRTRQRGVHRRRDQADDVADRLDVGMVGLNTTVKSAPTCRSAGSRTPASDANSAASASTSSRTRSSSASLTIHATTEHRRNHARSRLLRKPQARDRGRPRADARRRPGQGTRQPKRHLRHRPARVLRRADLHPARSEPHPLTGKAHAPRSSATSSPASSPRSARGSLTCTRATASPSNRSTDAVQCRPCKTGHYNLCTSVGFHGLMADGGMAEYTVVPRNQMHPLPDSVPVEIGALVEPMSVAYHAAGLGEVGDQSSALIYGAGPIGIGLWFALRGMGLTEIDVVEPSPTRRSVDRGARRPHPRSDQQSTSPP